MNSSPGNQLQEIPVPEVFSVFEISRILKEVLEDPRLQDVWIHGELTNFKCHHTGNCWFSLTEQREGRSYAIECVMWKSDIANLSFAPGNGLDVLVFGYIDHYPPQGKTQLYVRDMRKAGEGEKHLLVERWKKELAAEGHFALERKRTLPAFPLRVGVVTSPTGAVIEDIKNVIGRRFPVEILLSPTPVQGDLAYVSIAEAIRQIDGRVDVLIVARGGGSFEDLFPFNHPEVVKAISSCRSPVVSAIGHEVDVTLCDLAADVRAPTPSAAAELVVPDRSSLRNELMGLRDACLKRWEARLVSLHRILEENEVHLHPKRLQRRVSERRQELGDFGERLVRGTRARYERERLILDRFRATVCAKDPEAPLRKGYCIALKEGKTIRSARELARGDRLTLRLRDGEGKTIVEEVRYEENV
ncbi:MAG: exodeoxyribonuclease VII large subunit [Methanomicrobiales archaeon]|nr:exodeoxyribonuclease VII large subunit [Methanomicrobiales archaeon]